MDNRIKQGFFLLFIFSVSFSYSQLLDLDYSFKRKSESLLKVDLLKQFMLSYDTNGSIGMTAEAINIRYVSKKGTDLSFSLIGTQILYFGSKSDKLNSFSQLMNPLGGRIGSIISFNQPISYKDKTSYSFTSSIGERMIVSNPIGNSVGFGNRYFLNTHGSLGLIYQKLFNENILENKSLMLWFSPQIIFSYSNKNNIERFFLNDLKTNSYGYSAELGLEYNKVLKIGLLLNQFINVENSSKLKSPTLRITVNYKLKKTKILDLNQQ